MELRELLASALNLFGALIFAPEDVVRQRDALLNDDYIAYAALNGMRLRYYDVVTPDGWILQLWRVQSPDILDEKLSAPVILSHGFGSSSLSYMMNARNESVAFILADNGYDVWLPNYRSNQYSNRILSGGKERKPETSDYYRTGWQYMADFDFPTVIQKVLNETKQSKVYVSGNSMGCTIAFAFLSTNHSFDDKIAHFAAVVPVLRFGDDSSMILRSHLSFTRALASVLPQPWFGIAFGRQYMATTGDKISKLSAFLESSFCALAPPLCFLVDELMGDRSILTTLTTSPHLNKTRAAIYYARSPSGITFMIEYNFAIEVGKTTWSKIDFRKVPQTLLTNVGEYNQTQPPNFDFAALRVPFSLYYVDNDVFTGHTTAEAVAASLHASDVKFIDGNGITHQETTAGFDIRCYTVNDFLSKFNSLEARRGEDRKNYRNDAAKFAGRLPFADGCINKSA